MRPNSRDLQPEIPGLVYSYGGHTFHNTLPKDGYGQTALDGDAEGCARSRRCLRHAARPVASADVIAANRLDWHLLKNFPREFDGLYFTGGRGCPGCCTFCAKLHGQEVRVKTALQLIQEIEGADSKVTDGTLRVTRWDLFKHADRLPYGTCGTGQGVERPLAGPAGVPIPTGAEGKAKFAWASVYDEDFFLDRRRAAEFFRLWGESPLSHRYRLSVQTNPRSLLTNEGTVHADLFRWIDRLKPMIQLGAESFDPRLLARWRKRHTVQQLLTVVDAMEETRQDYTVFILLSDFDSTPEELLESVRRLALAALPRRRMRIAANPFTIPLYDSETRAILEHRGFLTPERVRHFLDFERPQPGWMDPLAGALAGLAGEELHWAMELPDRDPALVKAMTVVADRIAEEARRAEHDPSAAGLSRRRCRRLHDQAQRAVDEVMEARFQPVGDRD